MDGADINIIFILKTNFKSVHCSSPTKFAFNVQRANLADGLSNLKSLYFCMNITFIRRGG